MCGGCVYDGRPLDGVEVTTAADGTIRLRGPMRASGYLEASDRATSPFSDDGWFTTDDVGELVDGILTVHGRRDDTIISGGVKVSASALERELSAISGFDDVAIVGVPDPEWGERIRLVIARTDRAILPEEMVRSLLDQARGSLAERVPRTHLPKELLLVERIDRTGLGKLTSDERRRIQELGGATTLSETTSSDS
jgi:O-succinylbenzoic acid--CoA ligase